MTPAIASGSSIVKRGGPPPDCHGQYTFFPDPTQALRRPWVGFMLVEPDFTGR
jgi:hypothetical protein